jgi:hypothetical protein
VDLEQRLAARQVADEADAGQQQVRLERRDVRPVTDARLEYADDRQRADGLAKRAARDAEPFGELVLARSGGARPP